MKYRYFIISLVLLITNGVRAQDLLPFASGNYAGVTGLALQPASIADSRYKFDMSVSSTNFSFSNNFYGIDPYVLLHPKLLKDLDFTGPYVSRNMNGDEKYGFMGLKHDMFSFMVSLSKKSAIAFTPSVRTIININDMSETMAVLLDKLTDEPDLYDIKFTDENLNAQFNSWVDYGFTYARILADQDRHFFKAGATIKLNQGLGSGYIFMKDLNFEMNDEDTVSFYNTYTNYGTTTNVDENFKYRFDFSPSFSFDLGFVYEFRPDWKQFTYEMNGVSGIRRNDLNKYLLRIGITLSDLGNVRYQRNEMSRDFNADVYKLYTGDLEFSDIDDFNAFIDTTFTWFDVPDKYNMTLPLCLSLQADLRVAEGFYLNFTPYFAFNKGSNNVNKVRYISAINFVPRYDRKWFGISVPVQYNETRQWNIGLGLRLGPVWFGMNDLFSALLSNNNRYGSAATVVIKIPVLYETPHDLDGDNVSDEKDLCPQNPGLVELNGCPDTDRDGVADMNDKCPNLAGIKEMSGCPDRDSDGVTDEKDQCPEIKGLAQFNGCPDSDGDGIIDQNDACPYNAGSIILAGCPDQDSDGIPDKEDNCPTVAGTREFKGCPYIDTDGDGIIDQTDKCPGLKGPPDNFGCPYQDTDNDSIPDKDDECPGIAGSSIFRGCPDTDKDGISDKYDICPTIAGVPQNNGCPEIKKEEQEILKKAFSNLEFETGKSVIRSSSFSSLNELGIVLQKRPEFRLSLSGHTDNVGSPSSNMTLSKNRVYAVKAYLVKQGVDPDKIKTEWFGQTRPIVSNSNEEGRQKNRRVEMKIIFK